MADLEPTAPTPVGKDERPSHLDTVLIVAAALVAVALMIWR